MWGEVKVFVGELTLPDSESGPHFWAEWNGAEPDMASPGVKPRRVVYSFAADRNPFKMLQSMIIESRNPEDLVDYLWTFPGAVFNVRGAWLYEEKLPEGAKAIMRTTSCQAGAAL